MSGALRDCSGVRAGPPRRRTRHAHRPPDGGRVRRGRRGAPGEPWPARGARLRLREPRSRLRGPGGPERGVCALPPRRPATGRACAAPAASTCTTATSATPGNEWSAASPPWKAGASARSTSRGRSAGSSRSRDWCPGAPRADHDGPGRHGRRNADARARRGGGPGGHGHPEPSRGTQRDLGELHRQLDAAITELDGRDDVGCIVLTGADPAFCAGMDLKSLATEPRSVQQERQRGPVRRVRHDAPAPDARSSAPSTGRR